MIECASILKECEGGKSKSYVKVLAKECDVKIDFYESIYVGHQGVEVTGKAYNVRKMLKKLGVA